MAKKILKKNQGEFDISEPDQFGRIQLVRVSETIWPELWQNLRDRNRQSEPESIKEWAAKQGRGIYDDWFIEILKRTAQSWLADPDSDAAQLKPGCEWATLPPIKIGNVFVPQLSRPYPDFNESLAGFRKRMLRQFQGQLDQYVATRRASHSFITNHQFQTHIRWTCLVLKGDDPTDIAEQLSPEDYEDSAQAVYRAVTRTAKRIGLTLHLRPPRTYTPS